jgi:glycosyltransferase involved in cell wall biosynthesis
MNGALRFCLVTTFYPPYHFGGDAVFVHRLARAETLTPLFSTLVSHQIGAPGPYARRLREILVAGRYDVIHFHNVSLAGGPGVLRYGDAVKLYTTHEYWLVCPTHVLFTFDREACHEKKCLRCTLHARRPPQLWRGTAHLSRCLAHLDRLLLPSKFAMQRHTDDGVVAPMEVLPSFVPVPLEQPPRDDGADAGFLFVGRLEKLKGLQELFPMLRDFPAARLRIAGTGYYEGELRRLATGLSNVEFLGQVHPARVAELYREALAVIVPSLCYEVFPLAAAEALAHGVPVIGRRIGAVTEVVEDSGGGILFDTPVQCRAAMEQLIASPTLRAELGARGRRIALERWTEEVHLDRYLGLVRNLMENRAASRRPAA